MAWYEDSKRVKQNTKAPLARYQEIHKPGETVEWSGIYYCTGCGQERAMNEGDPFTTQNHKQHTTSDGEIRWKLLVRAETDK